MAEGLTQRRSSDAFAGERGASLSGFCRRVAMMSLVAHQFGFLVIPARAGIQGQREPLLASYWVYILASERNGTLYIGVTNDLVRRVWEHKNKVVKGFTEKYGADRLVHFEEFDDPRLAIEREKRMKKWNRAWKFELIEKTNPQWRDLYNDWSGSSGPVCPLSRE